VAGAPISRPGVWARPASSGGWPSFGADIATRLPKARIACNACNVDSRAKLDIDEVSRTVHRHRQQNAEETFKGSQQLWLHYGEGLDCFRRREPYTLVLALELKTGLA